jgi:hypothetical protein
MVIIHVVNKYEKETIFFDEAVRNVKRKQLESNVFDVRPPAISKGFISIFLLRTGLLKYKLKPL